MDNVVNFRGKAPIFNQELRQKLETGIADLTEKPHETVSTVEQIICAHIISIARRFAEMIGRRIGEKIARAANE